MAESKVSGKKSIFTRKEGAYLNMIHGVLVGHKTTMWALDETISQIGGEKKFHKIMKGIVDKCIREAKRV